MIKSKFRRGVTILELTIVLALLGIISTMIISFSLLTRNYTITSAQEEAVLDDLESVKRSFETWINAFDEANYTIVFCESNGSITRDYAPSYITYKRLEVRCDDKTYTFGFTDPVFKSLLIGTLPNGNKVTFSMTSEIEDYEFSFSGSLIIMSTKYSLYNSSGTELKAGKRTFAKAVRACSLEEDCA